MEMVGTLSKLGPLFGYNPNALKTYLVVKNKYVAAARRSFAGTCITVTTDGQRHLGAAIGTREYTTIYVTSKIKGWCDEIKRLVGLQMMTSPFHLITFVIMLNFKLICDPI